MATKSLQILGSLNQTAVQFVEQELTEEEKAQARENIGAAGLDADGKIPLEQLPDNIGSGSGGGLPADHTHDVEDIEGLLVEETFTKKTDTLWEYSDDMVVDVTLDLDGAYQYLYKFSDNADINNLVGMQLSTMNGNIIDITSEIIDLSAGVYHAIQVEGMGYILVFPADFDLSMVGLSGTVSAGSYASKYLMDGDITGVKSIHTEVEETKMSISNELLPSALQIGEVGTKIEWDGTPTDECIDDLVDVIGMVFYKIGEPIEAEDIIGSTIKIILSGKELFLTVSENNIISLNDKCYLIMDADGQPYASVSLEATSVNLLPITGMDLFFNCDTGGLWFLYGDDNTRTKALMSADYQIKQLDPKYIPANLDFNLSDYYTKSEMDEILGDCSVILDEISALIGE